MRSFIEQRNSFLRGENVSTQGDTDKVAAYEHHVEGYLVTSAIDLTGKPREDSDWWTEQGRPECWRMVEQRVINTNTQNIPCQVWLDTGYGQLALVINGLIEGTGKHNVISPDGSIVVLDVDYYGTSGYLFSHSN